MLYNWNDNFTLRFLNEYKNHPCLWNPSHENYINKCKKIEALNAIIKKLKLNSLTINSCLQHINTIRKTYIKEQEKEIEGLRSNKSYKSQVIWYDLFKGMVLEIIDKNNLKPVKSIVCVTPKEFVKLSSSPTRKNISYCKKDKPRPKSCIKEKTKGNNAIQNYHISPIRRNTQPVVSQDKNIYCTHPTTSFLNSDSRNNTCQNENDNDCVKKVLSDNQLKHSGHKCTNICKKPSILSVNQTVNSCLSKCDFTQKMKPSKHSHNFKGNLETSVPCPSFFPQHRTMAFGDCNAFLKSQCLDTDNLQRKKSYPDVIPCPVYTKYSKVNIDTNSDAKYLPCTSWNKSYDKDWPYKRLPERSKNYFLYKENFSRDNNDLYKCNNFMDDTSLQLRKNLDTRNILEPHSAISNKYFNNCDCKVLKTQSPLKIIIMDSNKSDAPCQSIEIESKRQEKALCINRRAACNKEIQCCNYSLKNSRGTSTDIGITCCRDTEVLPTVCVSSFTVGNKHQCSDVKETDKCHKCCIKCGTGCEKVSTDYNVHDTYLQDLTIKLMLECIEKVLKSQGKELFQQSPYCANDTNLNSNPERRTCTTKNSCTNTVISEEQCCSLVKEKSNCCFEQYLSKVRKENISNSELKEIMEIFKTFIVSQNENEANKKDRDNDHVQEDNEYYNRNNSLSIQTSESYFSNKHQVNTSSENSANNIFEDKWISKTVSLQDVENQNSPEMINDSTQTELEKGKIRFLYEMSLLNSCYDNCKESWTEDPTKVKFEDCNSFYTRTGVNEKLFKKIKNKKRFKDFE